MAEIGALLGGTGSINQLSNVLQSQLKKTEDTDSGFAQVLSEALDQYRQVDQAGDQASIDLLTGQTEDLSAALITTEKAEIALNFAVAVRNKAVEAYKEIMSMQI